MHTGWTAFRIEQERFDSSLCFAGIANLVEELRNSLHERGKPRRLTERRRYGVELPEVQGAQAARRGKTVLGPFVTIKRVLCSGKKIENDFAYIIADRTSSRVETGRYVGVNLAPRN